MPVENCYLLRGFVKLSGLRCPSAFFFPFCTPPPQRELFMCDYCSATEVGGKGGECRSEIVLHMGGLWVRCHTGRGVVNVLSTVDVCGGVMCYTREGKDSRAYGFSSENRCVTGMGGFRLIACVRENEKLSHGCN